jgi:hypothetical protein
MVFTAFTTIDYVQGQGTRINLKIPCTGETPGAQPTIPASFYNTATASQPLPAATVAPTAAGSTDLVAGTAYFCPTAVPETATAFASLGGGTPTVDLTGTSWAATDNTGGTYDMTFLEGGRLDIKEVAPHPTQMPCSNWQQNGNMVYLKVNYWTLDWQGQVDGSSMQGSAQNGSGFSWTWTANKR